MNMHFAPVADTAFKAAMSNLATAVSVVTTLSDGRPLGLTASSVTSFSTEPPCLAVNIHAETRTGQSLRVGSPLCINILAEGQGEFASVFAGRTDANGTDRFSLGQWHTVRSGAPALQGAIANIDCTVEDIIKRHTHAIVLARVVAIAPLNPGRPLLYWQREFRSLHG